MKTPMVIRLVAMLVATGVAFGVSALTEVDWGQIGLVVALIAIVMGIGLATRGEKRLPFMCDPMILMVAFCAQFFIVGPLALPLFDYHIFYQLPVDLVVRALLGFLLLFVCFYAGYQSRLAVTIGDMIPDFRGGRMKLPGRWAEWTIIAGAFGGIGTFFYFQGGLGQFLSLGYGQAKFSGIYQLPFHLLILATVLMAWRLADTPRPSKFDIAVFFLLLAYELVFYGIVLGIRNRVIFLFFSLFTVWIIRRGFTRMVKWSIVPVTIFLLVFFAAWGAMRHRSVKDMWTGTTEYERNTMTWSQSYFRSVSEPFAVSCIVMDIFPTVEPYRYGRTLLVTLLGFIPRAVWPEKPISFGKEVTRFTDGVFYNPSYGHSLTVTMLGDYYVNGGWVGIMIGGLLFGLLCRIVAHYTASGMQKGGVQTVAARALLAAVYASSMAEVRADTAAFLAYHGMVTMWLIPMLMFYRLDYSSPAQTATAEAENPERPIPQPARASV